MIDPKTLHIGSHVMVDGVRARVTDIESNYDCSGDTLLRFCAIIDGEKRTCGAFSQKDGVEPIPITEELLTELGFEKRQGLFGRRWIENAPHVAIKETNDGMWKVITSNHDYVYKNIICKYLHEAEAFLYLAAKTELIKE